MWFQCYRFGGCWFLEDGCFFKRVSVGDMIVMWYMSLVLLDDIIKKKEIGKLSFYKKFFYVSLDLLGKQKLLYLFN